MLLGFIDRRRRNFSTFHFSQQLAISYLRSNSARHFTGSDELSKYLFSELLFCHVILDHVNCGT